MNVSHRLSSMIGLSLLAHAALLSWNPRLVSPQPTLGAQASPPLALRLVTSTDKGGLPLPTPVERQPLPTDAQERVQQTPVDSAPRRQSILQRAADVDTSNPHANTATPTGSPVATVKAEETDDALTRAQHISQALRRRFEANFQYPWLARKRNWEGEVILALRVESDGRLSRIELDTSSGYPALDRSALKSAQHIGRITEAVHWLGGTPLDLTLPVRYRLTDG